MGVCSAEGCDAKSNARGLCRHHYNVWYFATPEVRARRIARNNGAEKYPRPKRGKKGSLDLKRSGGKDAPMNLAAWKSILAAWDHACAYCLCALRPLQQDHVVPLSRGGSEDRSNIVPACARCNVTKGAKDVYSWMRARGHDFDRFSATCERINSASAREEAA